MPSTIIIALLLAVLASFAPANDDAFRSADKALAAGEFETARDGFDEIVRSGNYAPEVFFGLGNAHYRLNEHGRAALAYRRALFLEPSFEEAHQNLKFLTDTGGIIDTATPDSGKRSTRLPARLLVTGIVVGTALALLALCALCALIVMRQKPGWMKVGAPTALVAGAALAAISASLAFARDAAQPPADAVVVVAPLALAHSAPASSASDIIELPPGSLLAVDAVRGSWSYVELPGGLKGWVNKTAIEPLWPFDPEFSR